MLENIKLDFRNIITELKNTLERINNRLGDIKQTWRQNSRNHQISKAKKNIFFNEDSLNELQENIKCTNISIIVVLEEEEEEERKGSRKYIW